MPTPAPSTIEHDPRWARVLARDASADGQFVYAVKTTGVYCQPSSPSRKWVADRETFPLISNTGAMI
ncbi:Ada metal-binding domain-containing protein, partial [Ralstonia pseudosolanacearum]|uniref:Ada metal-binding domain-containing protein n=1 Tax=Ralstonia pseudosolanacearum TaxID=1310165 RepID=UPI0032219A06